MADSPTPELRVLWATVYSRRARDLCGGTLKGWEASGVSQRQKNVAVRFSRQEAESKLGSRVLSRIAVDGIPAGATGHVVQLDEIERNGFDLIIEWSMLVQGKRQHNWFSKDDYDRCLIGEIEEAVKDV